MPCRSPVAGYKTPDGSVTFGQRKDSLGRFGFLTFRCGVCRDCRLYKAREWAIRAQHEASLHPRNSFLTLTFADDPGSISKRDLQLFFKSLRKVIPVPVRYFAVGEYGEQFSRPHYHVCLFGYDFPNKKPWRKTPKGSLVYVDETLSKAWPHGWANIGELNANSAGYTARYSLKKISGDAEQMHYTREFNGTEINVTPEFQLSSKRPAIGLRWIEQYWPEVARNDFVILNGKEAPVPRYYADWIKKHQPEAYEKMHAKRLAHYKDMEYETGKSQYNKALARDYKTAKLVRAYETSGTLSRPEPRQSVNR